MPSNPPHISEQEYLATEQHAIERHEYIAGKIYAMAGASRRHNRIALNIAFALRNATTGTPCEVFAADIKVHAQHSQAYFYPDVVASCAEDESNDYYLEQPCLIVEVTSSSTEWKDYTEKTLAYQQINSLQYYLIVSQDQAQVTVYFRDDQQQWAVTRYTDLGQVMTLSCPQVMSLSLEEIYQGVRLL